MVPREEALRARPMPALHPTSKSPTDGNAAYVHKLEEITTRFDRLVFVSHYFFITVEVMKSKILDRRLVNSVHSKRSCRKQSKIA